MADRMVEEDEEPCCADNWAVWLRVQTPIWALLLLVQVSMIAFLVTRRRKERTFRQAFYVFFVAVTAVDCILVLWVSELDLSQQGL